MAAGFDPAMVAIGGVVAAVDLCGGVGEERLDIREQGRPVRLQSQEIIAAASHDGLGDFALRAHRIDRHQGAGQDQPFQQQRDRRDLVRLGINGLLAQHQALTAGPGRDEMKRFTSFGTSMRTPRCLAINRDDVGCVLTQPFDPGAETRLEDLRVQRVDHVVQRVMRGYAMLVNQEPPQKVQPLSTPQRDLDKIIHAGQRPAQNQQQDFRQRIDHPPGLAWVLQRRKMIQKTPARQIRHGRPRVPTKHSMNHIPTKSETDPLRQGPLT